MKLGLNKLVKLRTFPAAWKDGRKSQRVKTVRGRELGWNLDVDWVHVGVNDSLCLIGVKV